MSEGQRVTEDSAERETSWTHVSFSPPASGCRGEDSMGEACPDKLGSTNHLRLLLYILPSVTLLAALLLLVLAFTGGLLDSPPVPSSSDPVTIGNNQSQRLSANNATAPYRSHGDGSPDWTTTPPSSSSLSSSSSSSSSSLATPTQHFTQAPDWLTSVSSLTTPWPIGTTAATDTGCRTITETQCLMLPYNQTWSSSPAAVVKSSEVDMMLRFFSYLSRLSCYKHIMLFGCSLGLPECVTVTATRQVILPCRSFCESAREGCEPVLQMFNASWPDFLRCSQFSDVTSSASPPTPMTTTAAATGPASSDSTTSCYSPRQITGKPSLCGGHDHFLCATGLCVPQKLVCNGYNDCDDWSDESHCDCSDSEFRCGTGRCVAPSLVCDGYDDCADMSDELNCECDPVRHHRCGEGRCVSRDWLCDGDHDCVDKTDELNCSCSSQGLVQCEDGQCVPPAFRCDGEEDCRDGSDERHCYADTTVQRGCVPGQTNCSSTSCSPVCGGGANPACDHAGNCSQCEPITLELCMNLPYSHTSFPNLLGHASQRESSVSWESSLFPALVQTGCYPFLMFYACTLLVPKCDPLTNQRVPPCRSLCRSAKERCESVLSIVGLQWPEDSDCSQFPEDTANSTSCLLPVPGVDECSPSHFKCRSGRCVLSSKRCDGEMDCEDNSDEDNCGCVERGLWECPGSKVCIKSSMICDGFPDCPLLVDEANCSVCHDNEVECSNHQCVHRTLWCDGVKHCSDSSDEWNCVSLSEGGVSVLTVYKSASQYQVCGDEWTAQLSTLTCNQLGLGVPSSVAMVPDQPGVQGRRRWLHVHPDWSMRNGSALQGLLEKRSHSCHSGNRVSVLCTREDCGLRLAVGGVSPPLGGVSKREGEGSPRHRRKRILGGRVSRPGAWPWQCSLQSGHSGHICGCVLIGRRWALTVAHCFEGRESANLWKVVLGINNLDHPGAHSQTRGVRSIIVHPRYNRAVVDYDISVIELDTEVEETSHVRPVCLPQAGELPLPDSYCYITGWGHMGNRMPFKLQEGEVRIISMAQCQSYFDMKTITSRMLCAGYEAGSVDSCMGDSGGPLVCAEPSSGRWVLFGLTSWGSVCFSKVLGPGVYSNVTHFTDWIHTHMYLRTYRLD